MFSRCFGLLLALLMTGGQGGQILDNWAADATAQLAAEHQCALVFLDEVLPDANRGLTATGHCTDGRVFVVELEGGQGHFVLSQVSQS